MAVVDDLPILKEKTVAKQEPFAAVLSCADPRVPAEHGLIGHVFVSRVAGHICTPEVIASLEYGAAVLSVPVILVLGHDGCGAVNAPIEGKSVLGQISAPYAPLRQAIERAGPGRAGFDRDHQSQCAGPGGYSAQGLGHVNIATTAVYLHLTEPTRASLKATLDKLMTDM
jgi:Carbonic anhydrase